MTRALTPAAGQEPLDLGDETDAFSRDAYRKSITCVLGPSNAG